MKMKSARIIAGICIVLICTSGPALAADNCLQCHQAELETLQASSHPVVACSDCHLGDPTASSRQGAHKGMVVEADGLAIMEQTCGKCHGPRVETYATSIHATVQGLKDGAVHMLGADFGAFVGENRCGKCHATCASCHLTLDAEGAPIAHTFTTQPDSQNCKACHDQTGTGYVGYEGVFEPSVHAQAGMSCVDCHGGQEMHGTGVRETRMAEVVQVSCLDCHAQSRNIIAHKLHADTLDCSACHVDWYYNCYGCHGYDRETTKELGYEKFNTNHYLARRMDNGKIGLIVHIPMSEAVGGPEYLHGAWVFKDRHSTQRKAKECQDCHMNAQVFVMDQYREAPFLGAVAGEFLPKEQVMNEILIFKSHAKLLPLKPGNTPDSECLQCHQ